MYLLVTNLFTSLYTVFINVSTGCVGCADLGTLFNSVPWPAPFPFPLQVVKKDTKLNNWALLYYSNVSSMPFLLVLAWYTGDLERAVFYPYHWDLMFQARAQQPVVGPQPVAGAWPLVIADRRTDHLRRPLCR